MHDNNPLNYRTETLRWPVPTMPVTYMVAAGFTLILTTLVLVSAVQAQQASPDLDGDGVEDALDLDQDNDGIINSLEGVQRLDDLSGLDAVFFSAVPSELTTRGSSRDYDLVSTENGSNATLSGRVLSTDTSVEWAMYESLPRLRNLSSGSTTVQWSVVGERQFDNIDLTISDLDGARDETIAVSASSIVGYSLSLNSNVQVSHLNGQFSFSGTGVGGDSIDDLVTLHFRESPLMVVSYSNGSQTSRADVTSGSVNNEIDIAGYRHSLAHESSTFFTPVTQFRDTDGDGVSDHRDLDSDNDGLGDVVEASGIDMDNDNLIDGPIDFQGLSAFADPGLNDEAVAAVYFGDISVSGTDTDGDGLLSSVDGALFAFGGSIAGTDSDSDGLSDLDEVRIFKTNPDEPDSDGDGLNDQSEVQNFSTNPLQFDTDGDELSDGDEINVFGTNPNAVDSDADGVSDGREIERGTDPLQALPAIVGDPQPPIVVEPEPVDDSGEDVAPNIDSMTNENDGVIQSDGGTSTGTDQGQGELLSLRTGLGGAPGCSNFAPGTPQPLLLLMLLMAIGCLSRNGKKIIIENGCENR